MCIRDRSTVTSCLPMQAESEYDQISQPSDNIITTLNTNIIVHLVSVSSAGKKSHSREYSPRFAINSTSLTDLLRTKMHRWDDSAEKEVKPPLSRQPKWPRGSECCSSRDASYLTPAQTKKKYHSNLWLSLIHI